jgi:fructoselysine 3-epimerase
MPVGQRHAFPAASCGPKPFKYAFNTWVYSSFPCWVPSYSIEEAIRRIARIGDDGYVAMELGFDRCDIEPDTVARQALEYLKPLVDAANAR